MKYIKMFEGFSEIFRKGDYVLLNTEEIFDNLISKNENPSNIKDKYAIVLEFEPRNNEGFPYKIEFYDGSTLRLNYYEIKRKMTPEEIEEFNTKKYSKKYNL